VAQRSSGLSMFHTYLLLDTPPEEGATSSRPLPQMTAARPLTLKEVAALPSPCQSMVWDVIR